MYSIDYTKKLIESDMENYHCGIFIEHFTIGLLHPIWFTCSDYDIFKNDPLYKYIKSLVNNRVLITGYLADNYILEFCFYRKLLPLRNKLMKKYCEEIN